ncbi:MAG TPA: acyl-CoA dehydrogenase family protein [Acidimicrobiales bacterium]|nr:acyl-CoA dehydrogenase family protein [Acidimicrobiales bacterium]
MSFRDELRAWLAAQRIPSHDAPFDELRAWNAALFDAGYAAPAWPAEFGGRDAQLEDQLAYNEEMARLAAPGPVNAIGVANIAPAIMSYGTDAQQQRFLRPMLRGDAIWSQGMSEPDAGSDLASLRCAAERDGDVFVVNGQKTWNSNGHFADWCQLYVRTNTAVPKHKGITCLLVDMTTAGIQARPVTTMAGDHSFAELFFTDVRVPVDAVLGAIDEGWSVATRTLSNERAGVASLYLSQRRTLDRLLEVAGPVDDVRRDELTARYIEVRLLEFVAKRMLGAALAGKAPGAEGSIVKLAWSQCAQRLANTAVAVTGDANGTWGRSLLSTRSLSIAGGTTEVNKNIVAERVLGLPREPKN